MSDVQRPGEGAPAAGVVDRETARQAGDFLREVLLSGRSGSAALDEVRHVFAFGPAEGASQPVGPCRAAEGATGIDCGLDDDHDLPHRGWWRADTDETGEWAMYIEWPVPERPDLAARASQRDVGGCTLACSEMHTFDPPCEAAARAPQPAPAQPRYLASVCAGCGHPYNFHASTGRCDGARPMSLPPDGAGVAQCGCQGFVDAPSAGPVVPGVAALLGHIERLERACAPDVPMLLPSEVRRLLAGGDR